MHGENAQVMKRMDKLNVDMTAKCELMSINIAFTQDQNRAKERQMDNWTSGWRSLPNRGRRWAINAKQCQPN